MGLDRKKEIFRFNNPQFRVEDDSENPILEGYATVFNKKTDLIYFTEEIAEGAFSGSIERGDDIAALIDHNPSQIVARTPNSLQLSEDAHGLKVRIQPSKTTVARDLIENIQSGNIKQMSIGFLIEEEAVNTSGDVPHFTITQARLFDVSAVTFPAYKDTEIGLARTDEIIDGELEVRLARCGYYSRAEAEKDFRDRKLRIESLRS